MWNLIKPLKIRNLREVKLFKSFNFLFIKGSSNNNSMISNEKEKVFLKENEENVRRQNGYTLKVYGNKENECLNNSDFSNKIRKENIKENSNLNKKRIHGQITENYEDLQGYKTPNNRQEMRYYKKTKY